MKILIVEDEKKTASYLEKGLTESGFVVDVAGSGEDGLHMARTGGYDLLVLDVMLPGRDGWSILSALQEAGVATPGVYSDRTSSA
jgi:two-component system copper resistance phosphate regulon response regulator CusR